MAEEGEVGFESEEFFNVGYFSMMEKQEIVGKTLSKEEIFEDYERMKPSKVKMN